VILWLLDTDCISLFQNGFLPVVRRVRMTEPTDLAVTVVTFEEQIRGRLNQIRRSVGSTQLSKAYQDLQVTQSFFCRMTIMPFTEEAEFKFGELRRQGIRIGTQDLRIASIALSIKATLVTRNFRDFEKIPQLRLEDWTLS
jgi:tRNA(fMet)-specific endonuclease VapC